MTKVMLVEDDNNLREIYGARLMAEGYEIVSASDGEEALALAVKEKPALIVADVMMPKISGFDMLDILRTTPETKNTKVIIMTALSQPEDRSRGESLGADKYLVKSQVTLEDVVAAVHEILGDSGGNTPASSSPGNPPAPAGGGSSGQTSPQQPAQPAGDSGQGGNAGQSPGQQQPPEQQAAPPAEQAKPQTPPSQPEDQPPKVEGASDAPEPASKKKKIIKPINDLNHEREDFLKMVAEEEAREKQSTPGASVGPVDDTTDEQQQAKMADSMAKEKKQMEEDVKKMVNDGTIDNEAASPTVQPGQSDTAQQQPAHTAGGQAPAEQPQQPAPQQPSPPAPKPPTEQQQTQPQPNQQAPQPQADQQTQAEPQSSPDTAGVPQPGSSVQPQDSQGGNESEDGQTGASPGARGAVNDQAGGQPAQPAQPQQPPEQSQQPTPPAPKPPAAPSKPPAEQAKQAGSEDANSQVPQPPKEKPQQDQGDAQKSNPDDVAL